MNNKQRESNEVVKIRFVTCRVEKCPQCKGSGKLMHFDDSMGVPGVPFECYNCKGSPIKGHILTPVGPWKNNY